METAAIIIFAIAIAIVAIIAWREFGNKKRTTHLRDQFGPEYDRTVISSDNRHDAERKLAEREKRVQRLDIRPLSDVQRQDYAERWRVVQARFVDDPVGAVSDSDHLVNAVMTARGYPMGEWEQRADDVSVDHPLVVANYRAARRISSLSGDGRASTEELRQAMVHYRALFEELLLPESAAARR